MITPELREVLADLDHMFESGLKEQLKVPEDWVYRSGYTSRIAFTEMTNILGEENYVYVSGSERFDVGNRKSLGMRFSIFISPEGMDILGKWVVENNT